MIKTKEDLINTYIKNDFGELRDLYLSKCYEFGFSVNKACYSTASPLIFTKGLVELCGNTDHATNVEYIDKKYGKMKKFTLEDLKPNPSPRTRATYEKVTEDFFFLKGEFERGELYYLGDEGSYYVCNTIVNLALAMESDICYRKVETPMDWKEILMEILPEGWGVSIVDCSAFDQISIDELYNKEQAKVLAEGILKSIEESGEG